MLKKRIIPIVTIDGFSAVKTKNFNVRRNVGSIHTVLNTFNTRNVDELILIDIDASRHDRCIDPFLVGDVTSECFMPMTVGGGISKISDIEMLLRRGADKVSLNNLLLNGPEIVREAVREFGSQCIVASIDVKMIEGHYYVLDHLKSEYHKAETKIRDILDLGIGELLVTNIDRDGTMLGYDQELARVICDLSSVPVIYSGGASDDESFARLSSETRVSAFGASSIFYFSDITPDFIRKRLNQAGVPVRT